MVVYIHSGSCILACTLTNTNHVQSKQDRPNPVGSQTNACTPVMARPRIKAGGRESKVSRNPQDRRNSVTHHEYHSGPRRSAPRRGSQSAVRCGTHHLLHCRPKSLAVCDYQMLISQRVPSKQGGEDVYIHPRVRQSPITVLSLDHGDHLRCVLLLILQPSNLSRS